MSDLNVNPVFSLWNKQDISYCSFKSNEHLIEGLVGDTDLDILIDRNDYDDAVILLKKANYHQVEPVDVGSYPNVVNWYGIDDVTGALIHIHLHFELMTGKPLYKDYCLPWKEQFLGNRFLDETTETYCVDPAYEYVLLCTRLMVKRLTKPRKNHISDDIIKELDYLKIRIDENSLRHAIFDMYGIDDADYFLNSFWNVKDLSDSDFVKLYDCVKKMMKPNQRSSEIYALMRSYLNRGRRKISRIINKRFGRTLPLKKRFINNGLSVAFVGIDGSGKSTVSKEIQKWLDAEFDVKKYYAGAGDGKKDFLSSIALWTYKSISKKKTDRPTVEPEPQESGNNQKKGIKCRIKAIGSCIAYVRILRSNIRHMRDAEKLSKKGLICLMDRYPQNSLPYMHDGVKIKKYDTGKGLIHKYVLEEERLLNSVKDHPFDIVFRLVVDPETSYKRKPEESLESLKHKAETLKKVKLDAKSVIEIDANRSLEEVLMNIKSDIWAAL